MNRDRIEKLLALFGLPPAFSEPQLKQAYRDLVQVWHPDRHTGNARLRKKADDMLKEINEGERVLSSLLVDGRFDLRHFVPDDPAPRKEAGVQPSSGSASPPAEWQDSGDTPSPPSAGWRFVAICVLAIGLLSVVARTVVRMVSRSPASAPPAKVAFMKSESIDARNGFREFTFGMSPDAARAIQKPDEEVTDAGGNETLLAFVRQPVAALGDFPLDRVQLRFSAGQLYRMEVFFSKNQEGIYQAFTKAFGTSNTTDAPARDGQLVRARLWLGDRISATMQAPFNSPAATGWKSMEIVDLQLSQKALAQQKEDLNAELSPVGFHSLSFGLSAAETQSRVGGVRLKVVDEGGIGETRMDIPFQANRQLARIGIWPLDEIRCHFFQDRLYRVDLTFSKNRDELFQAFSARFPQAADSAAWARNQKDLQAKQWQDEKYGAAILAPRTAFPQWDRIILFQSEITKERRDFQDDAPNRAAREI